MAIHFTLTPRAYPCGGPMSLQDIDVGICEYLHIPVDNEYWACGWYDNIGFMLAIGLSWQTIKTQRANHIAAIKPDWPLGSILRVARLAAIVQFLDDNYLVNY